MNPMAGSQAEYIRCFEIALQPGSMFSVSFRIRMGFFSFRQRFSPINAGY